MRAGNIGVTEGSGKKLDTAIVATTEGDVHREGVFIGDPNTGTAVSEVSAAPPTPSDFALHTREVGQKVWSAGFSDVGASVLDALLTLRTAGTGIGYSQATGNLAITSGTTANAEFLARSIAFWDGALLLKYKTILSQRIVQNNFAILLADKIGESLPVTINGTTSISVTLAAHGYTALNVGQFMMIGGITGAAGVPGRYAIASIPDANTINFTVAGWPASGSCVVDIFGHTHVKHLYTATTATQMAWDTQRKGWANGDTTATINTTASPGHLVQTSIDGRNCFLSDSLTASTTTPAVATRASRFENAPDDTLPLYLYIWVYNGTSNPATTTTWTIGHIAVESLANLPVFVAGQRLQGAASPAPVIVNSGTVTLSANTPTLAAGTNLAGDVGIQYRATATGAATPLSVLSPSTPAATTVKAGAGRLIAINLQNSGVAFRSVKFFNVLVGSVSLGTTAAVFEVDIPAGGNIQLQVDGGIGFATAITYAITSAKGLTDNTATGLNANEVSGVLLYA